MLFRSESMLKYHILYFTQNSSVSHWLDLGAPGEKLLLGFTTYGRTYHLTTSANGLGAPTNGPADAGPYTRTAGFWAYYEVQLLDICILRNFHI